VFNAVGSVHVLVDVVGWFPIGRTFMPVSPARLLDTRAGSGTIDGVSAGSGPVGAGSTTVVQIAGRAGVPMSGVAGVVLSVTAVDVPDRSG
jgi:hypothetical protein